ncbi:MAG: HAMP domain-containing histidine kinase [Ardenticatenaceae bacterium]|nr:HAMP domain-containing histidine kinase [Ardenticatenaceae bacterium]MCB9444765.1 HAMP domain-containing histidine kinase [Ardenticatenaceae bacterium]
MAAIVTEKLISQAAQSAGSPVSGLEVLIPRIGELLIQQNLISSATLDTALEIQTRRAQSGSNILIGELLVELGYVSRQDLNQVITEHVFQLQSALALSHQRLEEQVAQQTRELQNALMQLAGLNKLQLNFVANVSHELRMPMQFLLGYLELMENRLLGPLTDEQAHTLVSMRGASQQLHQITEELLQFSSFANSQILLDLEPFKLEGPVITAVSHIQPKAQAKNIRFKRQLPFLPKVIADNEKITWVVEQLLDNAIKFTPSGGEVKIETIPLRGDVLVKVSDTGIGIPRHKLPTLFDPANLTGKTQSGHQTGVGLGLALVQKIVEAHGSTIEVESQVGQGSHFYFTLPALG